MPPELIQLVKDAGLAGFAIFFLWGGLKPNPWWVFFRHFQDVVAQHEQRYRDLKRDRDYWRTAALEGIEAAKASVGLAEPE